MPRAPDSFHAAGDRTQESQTGRPLFTKPRPELVRPLAIKARGHALEVAGQVIKKATEALGEVNEKL